MTLHCPASPDAGHALEATTQHAELVYLACHNRPIHEVLASTLRDILGEFDATFRGMTAEPVELQALLSARKRMIAELQAGLDADERAFLLSLARNEPNWTLLGIGHLEQLAALI